MKKRKSVLIRVTEVGMFGSVLFTRRGKPDPDAPGSICDWWATRLGITEERKYKIVAIPLKRRRVTA